VLHPLIIPTWITIFLLFVLRVIPTDSSKLWAITSLISTFTLALPILGIVIMKRTGFIDSLSMEDRSDRVIPMFFTTICFVLPQIFFFEILRYSNEMIVLMYAMTLCVLFGAIITNWYKISAHAISMGGVLSLVCYATFKSQDKIMLLPLIIALVSSGALLSARLFLQIHTPMQVFWGLFLGLAISFTACWFLL
jgi:hypothetical protein